MRHRITLVLPLAAFIILSALTLFFAACSGSGSVLDRIESGKASASRPQQLKDYDVVMLDAPPVKLSQMTGKNKIVVLNFWATWCGPCRQEIPQLKAIQREYQNQGVEIIGLTIEAPNQATEQVKAFAQEYEINYRLGFSSGEMFAAFNGPDPRGVIPQSFVFGRDGNLLPNGHIIGGGSGVHAKLQTLIEQALKGSS